MELLRPFHSPKIRELLADSFSLLTIKPSNKTIMPVLHAFECWTAKLSRPSQYVIETLPCGHLLILRLAVNTLHSQTEKRLLAMNEITKVMNAVIAVAVLTLTGCLISWMTTEGCKSVPV